MRIWKEISLWKREFIGSTPKVRGGGVGGASGLVRLCRGICLAGHHPSNFVIRDSRRGGFLFRLGSEQRSGDLDKLTQLTLSFAILSTEGSDPISVAEDSDLRKPEAWTRKRRRAGAETEAGTNRRRPRIAKPDGGSPRERNQLRSHSFRHPHGKERQSPRLTTEEASHSRPALGTVTRRVRSLPLLFYSLVSSLLAWYWLLAWVGDQHLLHLRLTVEPSLSKEVYHKLDFTLLDL